jgi:hypothetical protein
MAKSPLPELMADMTGWKELADKLADAYWSLPIADRAKAGILVGNYGEASAINLYRRMYRWQLAAIRTSGTGGPWA